MISTVNFEYVFAEGRKLEAMSLLFELSCAHQNPEFMQNVEEIPAKHRRTRSRNLRKEMEEDEK